MSKYTQRLAEDFKTAMKEKNTDWKDLVQMVRAGVLQIEKDKKIEATDEIVFEVVEKEVKKRRDLIKELDGQRPEAIAQAEKEIEILEQYLPEQLSEDEVKEIVQSVIAELNASGMKDMGGVIKETLSRVKGQTDGATISRFAKELLS